MTSLIIGAGEIGRALHKVLSDVHDVGLRDVEPGADDPKTVELLHVCIPFSAKFCEIVNEYRKRYQPKYTVVHSTVPPGTCTWLSAVHSPVIGIHPHLEKGIRTFVKFLAGPDASNVADYFRRAGLRVYLFDYPETTELMKVLDTTFYGICAEYTKDVKRQCDKYNVPFEAWSLWTNNYNTGYNQLGYPEFTRPNLVPIMKTLGGHCVRQNAALIDTPFTELIQKLNGQEEAASVQ